MFYVTGDPHGEIGRFMHDDEPIQKVLRGGDKLFIAGDFGFLYYTDEKRRAREEQELDFLTKKPYQILFVDGNHENFDLLNAYPVEEWCGGKVHVIRRDENGEPKVLHLMRGQVFEIKGKKIFTFGGGYSIDKESRVEGISWWPQEMPTDAEMKEAGINLAKHDYKVDWILTHAAPEETMNLFYPNHEEEKPLNNFLEWVCETVDYKYWYFGHLHEEKDLYRNQSALWFTVKNMETNESAEADDLTEE